jgi:N-acetylglucosamine-6-phosphate deacetylase
MATVTNANVVGPNGIIENASIVVEDGVIESVTSRGSASDEGEIIDAAGCTIFPGFIDVHIHGAVGVDVNEADVDGLVEIAAFLAKNGVAAWMPTLVPDSDENYVRVISAIEKLVELQSNRLIAQAVGVHYEGVFANEKMCGALRPQYFKSGQLAVGGLQLPRLDDGIHMTTLAPEIDGGIDLTKELVKEGWVASIGHTKAPVEILDAAFAAGARHVTHFFNAMTGLHHRDVGVVGWALSNRDVTFDIIADGMHVNPKMVELAVRTKSPDKVTLISDSVAPTGLGDGVFEIWGEKVSVSGRQTQNERGSIAGSVITVLDAVRQMLSLGFSAADVAKMASANPARLLGIDDKRGSIETGKRADLVAIDSNGEVRFTMIGGRLAAGDVA